MTCIIIYISQVFYAHLVLQVKIAVCGWEYLYILIAYFSHQLHWRQHSSCWRPGAHWGESGGVCGRKVEWCVWLKLELPGCVCCVQTAGLPCNRFLNQKVAVDHQHICVDVTKICYFSFIMQWTVEMCRDTSVSWLRILVFPRELYSFWGTSTYAVSSANEYL